MGWESGDKWWRGWKDDYLFIGLGVWDKRWFSKLDKLELEGKSVAEGADWEKDLSSCVAVCDKVNKTKGYEEIDFGKELEFDFAEKLSADLKGKDDLSKMTWLLIFTLPEGWRHW